MSFRKCTKKEYKNLARNLIDFFVYQIKVKVSAF